MKYNTIFYYSDVDKSYVTSVPRLPGCMSDGKTIEEAITNTDRIIEEWIQDAQEDGEVIPEPDSDELILTQCSITDVSGYILSKTGPITAMMLEKLTYYVLAWSLGWYGSPMFSERFQAWCDGPVCEELFKTHQGKRIVSNQLYPDNHTFSNSEKAIMDAVIETYGNYDAEWLSRLTHIEDPWFLTRGELNSSERSHRTIPQKLMHEYYSRALM